MRSFVIPPRTHVTGNASGVVSSEDAARLIADLERGLDASSRSGEVSIPLEFSNLQYTCSDCGYSTDHGQAMFPHQENQSQFHTRFERVRRSLNIVGLWPNRLMPGRSAKND